MQQHEIVFNYRQTLAKDSPAQKRRSPSEAASHRFQHQKIVLPDASVVDGCRER
jgi:hypothetical protein